MTRLWGGSKLGQIGYHLAQGGFYLRLNQTNDVPDDSFRRAVKIHREMVAESPKGRGRWGWDAYAV